MESTGASSQSSPSVDSIPPVQGPSPLFGSGSGGQFAKTPWWFRVLPFFLSAVFFLSAFFSIFSPLPLLFLHFRSGRAWAWLATFANAALVFAVSGPTSLALYGVFVAVVALVIPELTKKPRPVVAVIGRTLLTMLLVGGLAVAVYGLVKHSNPWVDFKHHMTHWIEQLAHPAQSGQSANPEWLSANLDEVKENILVELPSAIAVFSLILVWVNLSIVLRLNPNQIRERLGVDATFFRQWRSPDWLVWPTILAGFFLLVDFGTVSDVALNVFKFLMAIYAIQGLSILSHVFDVWNIRGWFRSMGFVLVVFLMMPLLLSIGFFDLWFDFRRKLRQS